MGHTHHTHEAAYSKVFLLGIVLNIVFILVEVFYGIVANSSALLADAGHNATDVLSLVFSWIAMWLSSRTSRGKYTYGLRKSTVLVSLVNAVLLFIAVYLIAVEAFRKFYNPEPVAGTQIIIVALVGVVINFSTALLFVKGSKEDLNIKSAFLHMSADAGVSLGVVVAGVIINLTGYQWIDPVVSYSIILVIVWGAWGVFKESINLAMDAAPQKIDIEHVHTFLSNIPEVDDVHDLHVWALSTTQTALTVHLVIPKPHDDILLHRISSDIKKTFPIEHTTLQIEKTKNHALHPAHCPL